MKLKKPVISVAPMVDKTDRYFRNFVRMINKDVLLYTEMVTAQAIIHGDLERILGFDEAEHPIALQIAATTPEDAYKAVKTAENYAYDEINLNVGCPSDRVSGNMMGACLMAYPELVLDILKAIKEATGKAVTIKHRIGIDGKGILSDNAEKTLFDKYEDMLNFINIIEKAGADRYTVHARIAVLAGLDPKQNREVPPLRYDEVYRLKAEKPYMQIEINGGIKTKKDITEHLKYVDGVMIGREFYDNPMLLAEVNSFYNNGEENISRYEVLEKMIPYLEKMEMNNERTHLFLRHTLGLFHNVKGSKYWKNNISSQNLKNNKGSLIIRKILKNSKECEI
ncbi:tRNA dihydrouridine(20/20a) synthase DusA [Sebaldella termitidis]|uniref:tRNA dihydrouridine(20/20a) synthase DusA n=1 Tax=Sebaldella termitidis TaxID=826 RepID=UPI003EBF48F9